MLPSLMLYLDIPNKNGHFKGILRSFNTIIEKKGKNTQEKKAPCEISLQYLLLEDISTFSSIRHHINYFKLVIF